MASDSASFSVAADAYDRYIGRYGPSLAVALIEFAAPRPPVLDVGCGPGALTVALAELLDRVAAVDPSEPFAQACAARLPEVDVRVASADALPFGDATFDTVLSQLVLNFLPDAPAGVAEMRRVTRPGGAVAGCVWDYSGEMTLLRAFWDAATALDPAAAELDEGRRFPDCRPEPLEELWRGAGLAHVTTAPLVATASYGDFDDLWEPLPLGVGPAGAYCASLDPEAQLRLKRAVHQRLGRGEGPFELTARAWAVRGTVP